MGNVVGAIGFLFLLVFVILPIFFGVSRAVENLISPRITIIKDDDDCCK